ncbi:MAG TPA: mechanosensitive ion channel domain-containing protein, partial [Stenotrophomonas sp.]|nr:mechanosensitive ion channel domain-containing protein [Stenotrophomonas sp.]
VAGEMDASAARVLSRPWSTWLLLCMLATLAFEPDAPVLTRQFAMLIALVPVLRLLPPGARRWLDVWPYVATGLYLLSGLGFVFLGSGFAFRLYTLFVSSAGLAATAWLLWRAKRRVDATGSLRRALRSAAWIALVLLAVAVVANVIGNVSLAEMLTGAVIDSAYLGLLLYVGVTAVVTLLHLLLNRPGLRRFRLTREHAPPLVQLLTRLAIAAAAVGWVLYSMESFRILRPIYRVLKQVLGHEFTIGDFSLSLGHVLVFVLAILIASWASRVTRLLLQDVLESRGIFARGVGNSIASLASYAVLVLGIVVALSAAGLKGTQLALVFGALGVGIGFGLQNVVNNFVSGLILIFERPIQPGDAIEVGTTQGRVRDIGMRATRIRTLDGADFVVPNGTLLSERLTNWTLMDRSRRLEVKLGVAYGSDPQQVMALLTECATHTAGIASAPAVSALFDGFGASSLDFTLRAWTHDYDNWTVIRSDLVTRIHAALAQAGIEIPFPQQDVRVRSWPQGGAEGTPPVPGAPA